MILTMDANKQSSKRCPAAHYQAVAKQDTDHAQQHCALSHAHNLTALHKLMLTHSPWKGNSWHERSPLST
jgi:hypothetical protein